MSVTSKSPLRFAGSVVNSGNVNTGEQNFTVGGGQVAVIYSGMQSGMQLSGNAPGAFAGTTGGDNVLLWSGGGRLKQVFTHQPMSGLFRITFYDSAVPTSGGPFVNSGHKILGYVWAPLLSGFLVPGATFSLDFPFQSGLCVGGLKSGVPGFTVAFTPEAQPTLVNPG